VIGGVVAGAHVLSVGHFHHRPLSIREYKALTHELMNRVKDSDLIFILANHYRTTPIFYYLKADRYHFVGRDYSQAIATRPDSRVWVLTWDLDDMPADMIDALTGYRPLEEIAVHGAHAALFEPTVASHEVRRSGLEPRTTNSQGRGRSRERVPSQE